MKRIFVTGISTAVGKTIAAAILTEALEADYWKPIQAGDLENSDSHTVKNLISNSRSRIHENSYALKTPMSPHAAADIDGLEIQLSKIIEPETRNHLVIEGAGGLLVPLNKSDTILDLIKPNYTVVVVSRHYLGSINHTLLTVEQIKHRGHTPVLLFSGDKHPSTEDIIVAKTGLQVIGRISEEPKFNKEVVRSYAGQLRPALNLM